jgi:acyl-[acyl-carrier-protein]-phospholipid O-acyltransferase/long-chain-fatty-acid--[acyl-carrier-protein] ligase
VNGLQIGLLTALIIVMALVVIGYLWPRRFVRAPFRVLLALLYRREVKGLENLPKTGGCVVISNHV